MGTANPKSRQRGRPRDPTLTDEERRAHRRLRPKQSAQDQQPERLVTVTLKLAHGRNGQWIGPGVVTVPYGLAQELLYSEHEQARQAQKLQDFWRGDLG
jgi:hypothetical protein